MVKRKKWSSSEKFEIALLAVKGETTLNEICKRYSVAPCQVHAWKKQLLEQGAQLFGKSEKPAANSTGTASKCGQEGLCTVKFASPVRAPKCES